MGLGNPLPASDNEASTDNDLSQQSISELVAILRSAFRSSVFDKVEEILIARESKLLKKIACKHRKLSLALMDKLQTEDDLKICQRNCDEIKNTLRIRDETCLDLQEELKKSDRLISDLNLKNLTLEAAKNRAEAEVKALRAKVGDFNQRVMHLEKEFKEIEKLRGPHTKVKLEADGDTFSNLETNHPTKEGFRDCLPAESPQDVPNFKLGLTKNDSADRKENLRLPAAADTDHGIIENAAGVIVIVDTDDDDECCRRGTSGAEERTPQSVAGNGGFPNSTKMESIKTNLTGSPKRKWVAGDSWRKSALLAGDLDSDSEVSSSSSSDSDVAVGNKEGKRLRTILNLGIPIFK